VLQHYRPLTFWIRAAITLVVMGGFGGTSERALAVTALENLSQSDTTLSVGTQEFHTNSNAYVRSAEFATQFPGESMISTLVTLSVTGESVVSGLEEVYAAQVSTQNPLPAESAPPSGTRLSGATTTLTFGGGRQVIIRSFIAVGASAFSGADSAIYARGQITGEGLSTGGTIASSGGQQGISAAPGAGRVQSYLINEDSTAGWDPTKTYRNQLMQENIARLSAGAHLNYSGETTISGQFPSLAQFSYAKYPDGVIVQVDGNLVIASGTQITRPTTFIVNGDVEIEQNLDRDSTASAGFIVIAPGAQVRFGATAQRVNAAFFVPQGTVDFEPTGPATDSLVVHGSIVGERIINLGKRVLAERTAFGVVVESDGQLSLFPPPGFSNFLAPRVRAEQ